MGQWVTITKVATVTGGTSVAETYTPANGKSITVGKFVGNPSSSAQACVELIWDYGGGGEEKLWVISNGEEMLDTPERTGDGTKKLAVLLNNGCSNTYNMSGSCEFYED